MHGSTRRTREHASYGACQVDRQFAPCLLNNAQAELAEEKDATTVLRSQNQKQEEEIELLYETVARFQVLQGVTPTGSSQDSSRHSIDRLRRQLVDLETIALQKEMGTQQEEDPAELCARGNIDPSTHTFQISTASSCHMTFRAFIICLSQECNDREIEDANSRSISANP